MLGLPLPFQAEMNRGSIRYVAVVLPESAHVSARVFISLAWGSLSAASVFSIRASACCTGSFSESPSFGASGVLQQHREL
ncbi:MAG: hypothetical protein EA399_03050 [Desulfovibrionales bacterium]|nr:MAG: hypothetical protein EA399_03050 [Desulfovibrionales bacterium]